MKKKFLAVYQWVGNQGYGFGNIDFTCNYDHPTIESIRDAEKQIKEKIGYSSVVLLNIIRLADEDEESEDEG